MKREAMTKRIVTTLLMLTVAGCQRPASAPAQDQGEPTVKPQIAAVQRSAFERAEFLRSWTDHVVFEQPEWHRDFTGNSEEDWVIYKVLFQLTREESEIVTKQALRYMDFRYSEFINRRAWGFIHAVPWLQSTLIRGKLADLRLRIRGRGELNLIPVPIYYKGSYPELFDIHHDMVMQRHKHGDGWRKAQDDGCWSMLYAFKELIPEYDRWFNHFKAARASDAEREQYWSHVRNWLNEHPEARNWAIQQYGERLKRRVESETRLVELRGKASAANREWTTDFEIQNLLSQGVYGAAEEWRQYREEFREELADRRGICGPSADPQPAQDP